MLCALLQVVWTEMCVGSVFTQPPYNDKNPPSFFFYLLKYLPLSQIKPSVCVTSHGWSPLPRLLIDSSVSAQTALVSYLRPALSELSSVVSPPEQMQTRMTPKWLRCFVVGCNNKHSSSHLLPSPERLKRITSRRTANAMRCALETVTMCWFWTHLSHGLTKASHMDWQELCARVSYFSHSAQIQIFHNIYMFAM